MVVDFHSHTTASDGDLSPVELLLRAQRMGVEQLAITDHDSVDGLLDVMSGHTALTLVPGVELSCLWGKALIHVVGLNIDPHAEVLTNGLAEQQQVRVRRAYLIAEKLEKYGFTGTYDGARALAGDGQIGRPHFARFLVAEGHVNSENEAFRKYLGAGKPGDIKQMWPALATVVQWITQSGGTAVLAHPLKYKLTATRLRALTTDFKAAGGRAIEVINGQQTADKTRSLCDLAQRFDMLASLGSDFHRPDMPWSELGRMGELPSGCKPVWTDWE